MPRREREGEYIGPLEHLQGERALLLDADDPSKVRAQFHNRYSLTLKCRVAASESDFETNLGIGWHEFPAEAFRVLGG